MSRVPRVGVLVLLTGGGLAAIALTGASSSASRNGVASQGDAPRVCDVERAVWEKSIERMTTALSAEETNRVLLDHLIEARETALAEYCDCLSSEPGDTGPRSDFGQAVILAATPRPTVTPPIRRFPNRTPVLFRTKPPRRGTPPAALRTPQLTPRVRPPTKGTPRPTQSPSVPKRTPRPSGT